MLSSSRKRSRSPSSGESATKDPRMTTESQSQRLHEITAQTGELVKALSTVNDTVLRDLLERWRGAQHQTMSTRQQLLDTERRLLAAQRGRVSTELRALQHEETDTCRAHVVELLSTQLQTCGSRVVHTLSECMANSTRKALAAVQDRVQSGKSVNIALIEHVREFITTAFGALEDNTQRALRAELQSVEKDVTSARLQSALSLASAREARHADEIEALLRVVATLAEKSTHVREATEQLERAKAHVTALERQLDLNGIVAAVAPAESLIPRRKAPAAASSPSAPAPAAPPAALAKTAPEYFAVRMMAHMDITLSELVQRWRDQENTIIQWQNKYHDLEASVYQLRHDALIAHQTLLEEQQRRSIAERRVTEMVRERLMPNEEAAAVQELTRLRWSYTQAVDDAAQLAVSLAACRDALAESRAASAALQERLLQVEKDAAVDEVAAALLRMRSYYEGALQSVQNDLTDAEVQRRLLSTTVKTCQGVITEARSALKSSQDNSNELSLEVERHLAAARDVQSAAHRTGLTQLEDVRLAVTGEAERVESRRAQREKQQTIITSLQEQAVKQYESQLMTLVNTLEDPLLRDGRDVQKPLDVGAYTQDVLSTKQTAEHLATMRGVMLEALQFVEEHLRTTGIERANLLDASVSDAEHMTVILANLKEVTAQRDKARTELQACHALIQANHLTVVERALSHEVSVPDSLDAAEAAERVGLLQAQQAALQQAYDRAAEEHRATVVHAAELQESLTEVRRRDAMQQQQQQALRLALEASQTREQKLAESLASLQCRVETLVETSTASSHEAPVATADPGAALHSLTAVLERLKGTMEVLDTQIRTADPAGSGDANATAESNVSTDGVVKRLESGGMWQLVPLLRETMAQAGLLQHAMHDYSLQSAVSLTDCAKAVGKESTLCTAEMLAVAEAQARSSALEATLKAERTAMQQRLEAAEAATRKADETNQRVLNISKGLMEKQAWLVGEVRRLRTELAEKEGQLKTLLPAQPPAPLEALEEVQSVMAEPAASVAPSLTDASEEDLAAAPEPVADNEDEVGATPVAADPTDTEVVRTAADGEEVGGTADAAVDPSIGGATPHPPADADVPAASVEHEETLER